MKNKYGVIAIIFIVFIFIIANVVMGVEKELLLLDLDENQEINQEDYSLIFKNIVAKKTGKHQEWLLENNENLNLANCLAIQRYIYASNNDKVYEEHTDWVHNLVEKVELQINTKLIKLDLNSNKEYQLNVVSQNCGELKYESNNTQVVKISQEGNIVAVGKGEALIKVSDERNLVSEECRVIVEANPTSIALNQESICLDMTEHDEERLIASVTPNNKDTDSTVYWSSSDEKIATVDEEGNVKAIANGNCIIYAKTSNNKVAQCMVTVNTSPDSIRFEKNSLILDMNGNKTETLKTKILPETTNINHKVTWKSTNEAVATVDNTGMVTAKKIGECQVQAITENGKQCSINVSVKTSPEGIIINPSEVQIDLSDNKSIKLNATITPSTSSINQEITWSSSNENIAIVDEEGNVTGVNNGQCTITARTENGKEGNCKIKVYTTPKEISMSNTATLDMSEKNTMSLTAVVLPRTANTDTNITWSSSNENIATVDEKGVITGKANGECEIKAVTGNGKEAICNLTVVGAESPSVTIERNYQGRILTAGSIAEYRIIMNGNNISKIDTDKIKLKGSMANSSKLEVREENNEILVSVSVGEGVGTLGLEIDENMLTNKAGKTSKSTEIEEDYVFTLNETTSGKEETNGACIAVAVGVHNSFYIKSYDFYLGDTKKVGNRTTNEYTYEGLNEGETYKVRVHMEVYKDKETDDTIDGWLEKDITVEENPGVEVHFLDTTIRLSGADYAGASDCIFIKTETGKTIMIDTAADGNGVGHINWVDKIDSYLRKEKNARDGSALVEADSNGIVNIDYLILTHEHWDHVGGFSKLTGVKYSAYGNGYTENEDNEINGEKIRYNFGKIILNKNATEYEPDKVIEYNGQQVVEGAEGADSCEASKNKTIYCYAKNTGKLMKVTAGNVLKVDNVVLNIFSPYPSQDVPGGWMSTNVIRRQPSVYYSGGNLSKVGLTTGNNNSVVAKLLCGSRKMLFMGDAEWFTEEILLGIPSKQIQASDTTLQNGLAIDSSNGSEAGDSLVYKDYTSLTYDLVTNGKERYGCNSIEEFEEKYKISRLTSKDLQAQVLKKGHHGVGNTTSYSFLCNVRPNKIVSTGENTSSNYQNSMIKCVNTGPDYCIRKYYNSEYSGSTVGSPISSSNWHYFVYGTMKTSSDRHGKGNFYLFTEDGKGWDYTDARSK